MTLFVPWRPAPSLGAGLGPSGSALSHCSEPGSVQMEPKEKMAEGRSQEQPGEQGLGERCCTEAEGGREQQLHWRHAFLGTPWMRWLNSSCRLSCLFSVMPPGDGGWILHAMTPGTHGLPRNQRAGGSKAMYTALEDCIDVPYTLFISNKDPWHVIYGRPRVPGGPTWPTEPGYTLFLPQEPRRHWVTATGE